jgi:hemerythrin-like domain-containing protein
MRKAMRSELFEISAGFDEPLEMLLACHRRIERQLETLKRLHARLESHAVDAEASSAAQALLKYFDGAGANHHADEEVDLFPLLDARIIDPAEHERFVSFRAKLESDHHELQSNWTRLKKPLEGIAEGLTRTLPAADVHAFTWGYAHHILVEESALREFFERWLDAPDRETLGRAMAARRTPRS